MAALASWSVLISTKPKPFDRPVSRSMMTCADSTVPKGANICSRCAVGHAVIEAADVQLPAHVGLPKKEGLRDAARTGTRRV